MADGRGKNGRDDDGSAAGPSQARANRREFALEAEEILERIFEDLSDLQDSRFAQTEIDPDLINRIFRSAHSLKGLAGMFGLEAISQLAHRLEDLLDGLRLGRIPLEAPIVDLLDEGIALLASLMAAVEEGSEPGVDSDTSAAVAAFTGRVEEAARGAVDDPLDDFEALGIDSSLLRALTEYEEHRLRDNLHRSRSISRIDTGFEIADFEAGLSEISEAVREFGEVISTLPAAGGASPNQIRFSLLVATDIAATEIAERLADRDVSTRAIVEGAGPREVPVESMLAAQIEPETEASPSAQPDSPQPDPPRAEAGPEQPNPPSVDAGSPGSLRSLGESVRVDIRKLDELMNLVGELMIQRNAVGEVVDRLSSDASTARLGVELGKIHLVLARKLKELQAGVLDVRMVPMRQVFEKLSRVVRRLRRDLDKQVELDFSGADTELDKLIVEELIDPLVHLVHNAFDHAIESTDERQELGKHPHGTIFVRAMQRGNHVVIEVEDDGRGMDPSAILAKAIERGLVSESDVLAERDVLNLVFEPGFSTREEVTATSGRGVGMDVVKSNLAVMGGSVELTSVPGRGTTVTITLPITLAIMQALIVEVAGEQFAIPLGSVRETLVVEPSEIEHSEDREILDLRGEPLGLRRLAEEFELASTGRSARQFVVVLGLGEQRIGLLVDRLVGQQDAVIKPIKGPVQRIRGIAGAAELGGANAILVVDVSAIIGESGRRREAA